MIWICLVIYLSCVTANGLHSLNQLWSKDFLRVSNLLGKPISDHTLQLYDGRIIVSVPTDNEPLKANKGYNLCMTSNRQIGICTRLIECNGFNLPTLHNNICFMDLFAVGVCCDNPSGVKITKFPSITTEVPATTKAVIKVEKEKKVNRPVIGTVNKSNEDCGVNTIPASRIVNGQSAEDGKWPWMAALYTNTFLGRKYHCGGSLISEQHVLTGAHCVKGPNGRTVQPNQLSVRLGDSDISTLTDTLNPSRFFSVQEIRAHPDFQDINHYFLNDVAVLKLNDKVVLSTFISPICLPTPDIIAEPLDSFAGRYSTILGFGRTELGIPSQQLQEAIVPVWENKECDKAYFAPITEIFICAGYKAGGIDACQGDSGGPMQIETDSRWTQIGITSFGKGCGEPGFPGVYTRVSKFTAWIKKNML